MSVCLLGVQNAVTLFYVNVRNVYGFSNATLVRIGKEYYFVSTANASDVCLRASATTEPIAPVQKPECLFEEQPRS